MCKRVSLIKFCLLIKIQIAFRRKIFAGIFFGVVLVSFLVNMFL